MKSDYNITNLDKISENAIKNEMLTSDFIITKRGSCRDAISFFGEHLFSKNIILDVNDKLDQTLIGRHSEHDKTKIAIDISLIDRKLLAELFSTIAKLAVQHCYDVCIIYSLAKYAPPSGVIYPNTKVKPVSHFFSGWSNRPGMPILSVVGLGYEQDKALGAIEFLESSEAFLYIPNSLEENYLADVLNKNERLLDHSEIKNQFPYQLESPVEVIYSLDSVISANKSKFKIVLLPFGPKLFYALSLLSCIPHPEVSVWYVSGEDGDADSSQDREISRLIGLKFSIEGI